MKAVIKRDYGKIRAPFLRQINALCMEHFPTNLYVEMERQASLQEAEAFSRHALASGEDVACGSDYPILNAEMEAAGHADIATAAKSIIAAHKSNSQAIAKMKLLRRSARQKIMSCIHAEEMEKIVNSFIEQINETDF